MIALMIVFGFFLFIALVTWSLCAIGGRADDRIDEIMKHEKSESKTNSKM
jgi:hypothetical protein